LNKSTISILDH